jgi:hypothetical protein
MSTPRSGLLLWALGALSACGGDKARREAERAEEAKVEARAQQLAQRIVAEFVQQERSLEEVRRVQDRLAAQARLLAAPNEFFEVSGLRLLTRGDNYRPLRSVLELSLTNKSRYAVSQINAHADFLLEGEVIASVPLTLRGGLPAGATRRFSVSDETLAGAAVQTTASEVRVVVSAVMLESPTQVATP